MSPDDKALEIAIGTYREIACWPIGPANHRDALRAAILAYESAKQKGEAEGWVLVPRELTNAMLWANAGTSDTHKPTWNRAMWAAFLAAAPEPPTMLSAGGEGQ